MKRTQCKLFRIYLIVTGLFIGLTVISFIVTLFFSEKLQGLNLVVLGLYIFVYCVSFSDRYRDFCAYSKYKGELLKEPNLIIGILLLSVSGLLMLYYIDQTVMNQFQSGSSINLIMIPFLIANLDLYGDTFPMVVFGNEEIYFKHRWVPYHKIEKMDSDLNMKRSVRIYLYADKFSTLSLPKKFYGHFESVMKSQGIFVIGKSK